MVTNILEYLEDSARKYPNKKAFADLEEFCTYQELVEKAKIIGTELSKCGYVRKPIPVLMGKSVHAVIAFMGIVYSGCFYTFLDSKQPVSRLKQILQTLEAKVILVDEALLPEARELEFEGRIICYQEAIQHEIEEEKLQDIRNQALDIDPLYTNFTSGSTGIPKGVTVSHRSVIDFMNYFTDIFHITEQDIIGNQAPFDFDVSVKDIYATLKVGATMEIIPRRMFSFPMELLDHLCKREVTTLIWAVSALCMITALKGLRYKVPKQLNKIIFSGEVMPIKHLNEWRKYLPNVMYANVYGPTEITCNCTYYIVDREFTPGDILPIGRPFPNEHVFLLDEMDQLVDHQEVGKLGEICISGTALALGYYNNIEQTSKAFVQNPLNKNYLELIYRTGDLGQYNSYGELCFTSRKDFQIKHMGHRIELGEIESAMEIVEGVERICCIYYEEKNKIIAFYTGLAGKQEIQNEIALRLPNYMLPNVYWQIQTMPLTKNGKIDRKDLMQQYREKK
ncbi:MAG: amino acid adenylation domain-containing protein [Lachnospiraceae bacterium]